jgi:predicted Zn-ribbon and HTH transcriptional regulator
MSVNYSRVSPLPLLPDDQYPCPQCGKPLLAEEFSGHLKNCRAHEDEGSLTDRLPSYTVMGYHDDKRLLCKNCGRKFMADRILKHQLICENLARKRPTFDMTKKIFPGLESEVTSSIKSKKKIKFSKEYEDKLWHKQHQDFINNMRFARKLVEVEEKGISTMGLKPPASLVEDLIECPICHRKFAPIPADRHIPRCRDIIHKPKPPPLYREPSTKLPEIKKSKMKELLLQHSPVSEGEFSMTPNQSKQTFEKSPSPNTTLQKISLTHDRMSDGRRSFKDSKLYTKCAHCRKLVLQINLKNHLNACKHISQNGIFHSQERVKNSKCPNCDYSLIPRAKFCMMCGLKLIDFCV